MKVFVVFGIGTDVGKTFVTSKILSNLHLSGNKVFAIKPVISGYDKNLNNDLKILCSAFNYKNFEDIALYKLKQPTSPDIAATNEGIEINYNEIITFIKHNISSQLARGCEHFFIETAGGIASPITKNNICLDLLADLVLIENINVIPVLVASNYLGMISHSITAISLFIQNKPSFTSKINIIANSYGSHECILSNSLSDIITQRFNNDAMFFKDYNDFIKNITNDIKID